MTQTHTPNSLFFFFLSWTQSRICLLSLINTQAEDKLKKTFFHQEAQKWIIPWTFRVFQTQIFSLDVPKGKCTLSKENKTGRHVVPTFHSLFECVFEEGTQEVWCMRVCVRHKCMYVSHTDMQICWSVCTCFFKQASIHLWECVCCMMLMSHSNCVPLSSPRIKIWTPPKKKSWLGWNVYYICSIWLWSLILVCVSRGALFSVRVATQDSFLMYCMW